MSCKNEELEECIKTYGLDREDYLNEKKELNRQKLNNILKIIDVQVGKAKEAIAVKEDGTVMDNKVSNGKLHKSLSGVMVSALSVPGSSRHGFRKSSLMVFFKMQLLQK